MTPTIVEVAKGTVDSVQLVEVVATPIARGVDDVTEVVSVQVVSIERSNSWCSGPWRAKSPWGRPG
jgi:hypothetical protein